MAAKQIVCDTDVMIDFWEVKNQRHFATKLILEETIGLDNVVLTAVTKIELLAGAINKSDIKKIRTYLDRYNILLINHDTTLKTFALIETYTLSHGLSLADAVIAATSIVSDLDLFTYNTRDFKFISELSLFKR